MEYLISTIKFINILHRKEVVTLIIIISAIIACNYLIRFFIIHRLKKHIQDIDLITKRYKRISHPVKIISIISGIWIFIYINNSHGFLSLKYTIVLNKAFKAAIMLCIAWFIMAAAKNMRNRIIEKRSRKDGDYDDFSIVHSIYKGIEIILLLIVFITVLSIFNIPISGIIAIGGIGGAALAFANQNLIANIFSGMAIFFDRPFSLGDWIYTIDGKIEGTVEKIGLRLTKLRGFDKRPIFVPNSMFNTTPTVNASRMSHRRIKQIIGLRYDDIHLVRKIISEIKKMLNEHNDIDHRMITLVNLLNGFTDIGGSIEGCFGNSSINILIYTFTKTTNWTKFQSVQDDVMLNIAEIVLNNGAQFAFPSRSIYMTEPSRIDGLSNGF